MISVSTGLHDSGLVAATCCDSLQDQLVHNRISKFYNPSVFMKWKGMLDSYNLPGLRDCRHALEFKTGTFK